MKDLRNPQHTRMLANLDNKWNQRELHPKQQVVIDQLQVHEEKHNEGRSTPVLQFLLKFWETKGAPP